MNPKNDLQLAWEVGWERVDEPQYEIDFLYQRYFNPNFQAFAGYRLTNDADAKDRGLIGINYRLPLMAWLNVSLDTEGDARFTLSKRLQLTPRIGVWGDVFYDTGTRWEWSAGADYTLTRRTSLTASYHSDFGPGVGLLIRF
jgi:outer membrane receptor protein involved in Fe transport